MNLRAKLSGLSVAWLVRVACFLALPALGSMAYSVLVPRPLPVIFAMSIGQALGVLAFLFYLAAIILDAARARAPSSRRSNQTETET